MFNVLACFQHIPFKEKWATNGTLFSGPDHVPDFVFDQIQVEEH